jgi:hypothetical protein
MATNLARDLDPDILAAAIETAGYGTRRASRAPPTSVLVAVSPLVEGVSGRYFADCNAAPVVDSTSRDPQGIRRRRLRTRPRQR